MTTLEERFDQKWEPEPNSGCHLWTGAQQRCGYGAIKFHAKLIPAHRASWIIKHGEIPEGIFVLHHCDTPSCVNPSHLFLGTQSDNLKDAARKGRMLQGEKNHRAKLTSDQVREIRASKDTYYQLAEKFGVNFGIIGYIKRRESWRHVSP